MIILRCMYCGAMLREVATRNAFTKHAGCGRCGILYVTWGDKVTVCETPLRCGGLLWIPNARDFARQVIVTPGPHCMGLI